MTERWLPISRWYELEFHTDVFCPDERTDEPMVRLFYRRYHPKSHFRMGVFKPDEARKIADALVKAADRAAADAMTL